MYFVRKETATELMESVADKIMDMSAYRDLIDSEKKARDKEAVREIFNLLNKVACAGAMAVSEESVQGADEDEWLDMCADCIAIAIMFFYQQTLGGADDCDYIDCSELTDEDIDFIVEHCDIDKDALIEAREEGYGMAIFGKDRDGGTHPMTLDDVRGELRTGRQSHTDDVIREILEGMIQEYKDKK